MEQAIAIALLVFFGLLFAFGNAALRSLRRRKDEQGIPAQMKRMKEQADARALDRARKEKCVYCGAKVAANATECKKCGAAL